jgi:hypothetical protein
MLQSVREAGEETLIIRRLTSEVGISFFNQHDSLSRPCSAFDLDPATCVIKRKRSRPQANRSRSQSRIGYFKNDTAYIFVSEEIVAREPEVVFRAFDVAEEGVAPPAGEETDIACLGNRRLTPY